MKKMIFVVVFALTLTWPCILFAQEAGQNEDLVLTWDKSIFKSVTFLETKESPVPKITNWLGFSPIPRYNGFSELVNPPKPKGHKSSVDWMGLAGGWATFLVVEHGIRLANPQVRANLSGNYFLDWKRSIQSIHGFRDGDRWFPNYVGHPLQGSVSMFIFARHDPYCQNVEFGWNRRYVLCKSRQFIAGLGYSEWFEMGPFLSETSFGNLGYQYSHNAWGDQVITPSVGLVVSIFEDWIYVKHIAKVRETNPNQANFSMIFMNLTRSIANLLSFTYPWRGPVPR